MKVQCSDMELEVSVFTLNDNKWSVPATLVILILKNLKQQITMWEKINVCSKLTNPFSLNDASQQSDEDVLLSRTFLLNEHLEGSDPAEEKGKKKKKKACLLELSLPVFHSFDYWTLIQVPQDSLCSQTYGIQHEALGTGSCHDEVEAELWASCVAVPHTKCYQTPSRDEVCAFLPNYPAAISEFEPKDSPSTGKKEHIKPQFQ